ncbi:hypothetical protein Tco_0250510 [Tanacetum coccineum]
MAHIRNAIMEEHRASMEAYKKVHEETVRSGLRMAIVQQRMETDTKGLIWVSDIVLPIERKKKRKGPFVWTKSKSRVVIEVGQTEAIDGGLNYDSRLANYEQQCQHFLMFDYDPQEGELQDLSKKNHHPELVKLNSAFKLAEKWVSNMTKTTDDKSTRVVLEARPPRLGIGVVVPRQPKVGLSNDPVERKLRAQVDAGKRKYSKIEEESRLNPKDDVTSDEDDESESRTKTFGLAAPAALTSNMIPFADYLVLFPFPLSFYPAIQ